MDILVWMESARDFTGVERMRDEQEKRDAIELYSFSGHLGVL